MFLMVPYKCLLGMYHVHVAGGNKMHVAGGTKMHVAGGIKIHMVKYFITGTPLDTDIIVIITEREL